MAWSHRPIAAALLTATFVVSARADPVVEFSGGSPVYAGSIPIVVGWKFTTTAAVTVTALDDWDPSGDGLVKLYNNSLDILASVNVTSSDPTEGSPTSLYSATITPVTLAPDTTYYITEDADANGATLSLTYTNPLTVNPLITYDGPVSAYYLGSFPTTDYLYGGRLSPGYFGPDFDTAATATPEPVSVALFGFGLAVLGCSRRRPRV